MDISEKLIQKNFVCVESALKSLSLSELEILRGYLYRKLSSYRSPDKNFDRDVFAIKIIVDRMDSFIDTIVIEEKKQQ